MSNIEASLFKDELISNSNIYSSIINSNENKSDLITIKIRIRQYQLNKKSNSIIKINKDMQNDISFSKIRISLVAFLNFPILKNEILLQQGHFNKEVNKIYLFIKDNEYLSFDSNEEWEEYFQYHDSLTKGSLKLEYSLKSSNRIEIEKNIQKKGQGLIIDFIDYIKKIAISNEEVRNKLNMFINDKKISSSIGNSHSHVQNSYDSQGNLYTSTVNIDDSSYNEEYNLVVYDVLFKTLKSNALYLKKISGLVDNNTTACGSSYDINKSQIPDFEAFFDEKENIDKDKEVSKGFKNSKHEQ